MNELGGLLLIAEFRAWVRRPLPLASGMVAQLFGENGPDADAVMTLGKTQYLDALVHVELSIEGESIGGFEGYVRRPKPTTAGMVCQVYGENGEAADMISALGLSKFLEEGVHVSVRLVQEASGAAFTKPEKGPYRKESATLWRSPFFRQRSTWEAVGSDEQFREWVQRQPSCVSGDFSEYVEGEGRCVAAHVRRAGESGIAHKAPYACVPLTDAEHQRQHQDGEGAFGGKDFFDKQRIKHVQQWAWDTVVAELGYSSMTFVPPSALRAWAVKKNISEGLPSGFGV